MAASDEKRPDDGGPQENGDPERARIVNDPEASASFREPLRYEVREVFATRRSAADLALAVSVAGGVIGLLAIFAGGFYAGYVELASINRELGGVLVKNDEFERRLSRLERGQAAIQADLTQVLRRLDDIERAIRAESDRATLDR